MPANPTSIRGEYERQDAEKYYRESGGEYRNPHEPQIIGALNEALQRWNPNLSSVLDLAAGSGEITLALRDRGTTKIAGVDPFTYRAYQKRVGKSAEQITFEQIAEGGLSTREFSLIVCSFAMHLCEKSRLPALAVQLSMIAPAMLILTPHKRPAIRSDWGWELCGEFVRQRVRARMYRSINAAQ